MMKDLSKKAFNRSSEHRLLAGYKEFKIEVLNKMLTRRGSDVHPEAEDSRMR